MISKGPLSPLSPSVRRLFALSAALLLTATLPVLGATAAAVDAPSTGLPTATAETVGMSTERLARIKPVMQQYVDEDKVPGVISLVARKGKVVHFGVVGEMNRETNEAMRPDTILRMYSQSKPVTGAAVMMLYEEGHFLLTDHVSKYLPALADLEVLTGANGQTEKARPMTIKHLLTHTSGLSYGFMGGTVGAKYQAADIDGAAYDTEIESLEAYVEKLGEMPLVAQPGTLWHYSISMDVLGRLVEVWSGQPFDEFLDERIFKPLGMNDTAFYVPESKADRFAANYAWTQNGLVLFDAPEKSPYLQKPALPMGGSGLVSTANDYLRFAQMLANSGELDGVRLLSRKSVDLMMSDHLGPEFGPNPINIGGSLGEVAQAGARGIGFGFTGSVIVDPAHLHTVGSAGTFSWGGAAYTQFWVDREEELVGLVLTQVMGNPHPLREKMIVLTYGAIAD